MVLALLTTIAMLTLAALCAHRLWHAERIWQALVLVPPMAGAWTASLLVRTPSDGAALLTFLAGDLALYGLSVLGVMRLLGELPNRSSDDDGEDGGGGGGDDGPPSDPDTGRGGGGRRAPMHPTRRSAIQRPRPARSRVRRRPVRDGQPAKRAPSTSSFGRSAPASW